MNNFSIILFNTTNNTMWAAKVLKKEGIERKLIPIPRHLSSDCGFCIRIQNETIPKVEIILQKNNIEYNGIETLS